jgi:hypothetical protein
MGTKHRPEQIPAHARALLRHFADLRDGSHGERFTRAEKEELFSDAVQLLDPYARQALAEIDEILLLSTGTVYGSGVRRGADGGAVAAWSLSWPEQAAAGVNPITLQADYGRIFHHPHLRGGTVGHWPLNVFNEVDAAQQLPTLRAIACADLHNLVYQRDYKIVPATVLPEGTHHDLLVREQSAEAAPVEPAGH